MCNLKAIGYCQCVVATYAHTKCMYVQVIESAHLPVTVVEGMRSLLLCLYIACAPSTESL